MKVPRTYVVGEEEDNRIKSKVRLFDLYSIQKNSEIKDGCMIIPNAISPGIERPKSE
jgi:hypothetical protein